MAGTFKAGFDNSDTNVKTFAVYDRPLIAPLSDSGNRHYACKNQECDRYACTASAEWCSKFCCPDCASGEGHTSACNEHIGGMREQLIPDAPVVDLYDLYPHLKAKAS